MTPTIIYVPYAIAKLKLSVKHTSLHSLQCIVTHNKDILRPNEQTIGDACWLLLNSTLDPNFISTKNPTPSYSSPVNSPKSCVSDDSSSTRSTSPIPVSPHNTKIADEPTVQAVPKSDTPLEPKLDVRKGNLEPVKLDLKSAKKPKKKDNTAKSINCSLISCKSILGNAKKHAKITLGGDEQFFCSTSHFLSDDTRKILEEQFARLLEMYEPNQEHIECQQCCKKPIDTNIRASTAKICTDEGKVYRPFYFCTIKCLLDFMRINSSAARWKNIVDKVTNIERASLPPVKKRSSAKK